MSDRLQVVYLDHCARLSGAELALLRLLPALRSEVDPHVILAEGGPLVARLRTAGISCEVLPMAEAARGLPRARMASMRPPVAGLVHTARYTAVLAGRLRRLRPDLVHTNSLKAGIYGCVAARLAGVPAVWHVRERIADDYLPPSAVRLVRTLVRRLPRAVVANSRGTMANVSPPQRATAVIASPVDVHGVERSRPAGSPVRVGMVGRLAPLKGQHLFLQAFARAFPQGEEQAVIVGSALFGEEGYEEELRSQVAALGLEDRVELAGFREDIAEELASMDVLVHASLIPEAFGQVVVEGMAAGLAVVATAAGGPAEVIVDGRDGLLYPMGDVDALAATLRRVAADGDLRARLGLLARRRALEFSPGAIAPQMVALYEAALGR